MIPSISEQDGLRYVAPYERILEIRIKKRWEGKTIEQLFTEEFAFLHYGIREFPLRLPINGHLRVTRGNKERRIDGDYRVAAGESLWLESTSVENPIPSLPTIAVLFETEELLAVNKPCGLPVHECVGYYHNTCIRILEASRGYQLYPLHRLDRVTSGIVVFAKTADAARKFEANQRSWPVTKTYIARVTGRCSVSEGSLADPALDPVVSPLRWDREKGVVEVSPEGSPCRTRVRVMKYLPLANESIVECIPITGRKHQIRVHLRSIGVPIVNDEKYGGHYDAEHPFAIPRVPGREGSSADITIPRGIFLHAYSMRFNDGTELHLQTDVPGWALSVV